MLILKAVFLCSVVWSLSDRSKHITHHRDDQLRTGIRLLKAGEQKVRIANVSSLSHEHSRS